MEQEESTINIAPEGRKQPKKINQAWGSNPESRPSAYCIGKSRLTIGPTRLIVVQLLTFTPSRPSSLDHPHKGAETKGGRPAYHWANPADCCSAPHIHTKSTKLPRPHSQRCQNFARLRRALFLFYLVFAPGAKSTSCVCTSTIMTRQFMSMSMWWHTLAKKVAGLAPLRAGPHNYASFEMVMDPVIPSCLSTKCSSKHTAGTCIFTDQPAGIGQATDRAWSFAVVSSRHNVAQPRQAT
jgi:hypothetical protein